MNKKGFFSYEALVIFIIIAFVIISALNINHQNSIVSSKIKKDIDNIEKNRIPNFKGCDRYCLIKEALLVLK